MFLNQVLESIHDDHGKANDVVPAGATSIGRNITKKVNEFTAAHNLDGNQNSFQVPEINKSLDDNALMAIGIDNIAALTKACGIGEQYSLNAKKFVAIDIGKNISCQGSDIISFQNMSDPMGTQISFSAPPSFIPNSIPDAHAFGVDIDKVSSDLRLTLSVDLMRFHTSLTPRIMHVKPTADAIIRYTKTKAEVFNNQDMDAPAVELVDLYEDATVVNPTLPLVVPRVANAAPAEGYISLGAQNLFDLSIDATKPGYSSYNRHDTIADGVYIKSIKYSVGRDAGTKTYFEVTAGKARGRLHFVTNGEASVRQVFFETDVVFTDVSTDIAGAPANIFGPFVAGDTMTVKVSLNVKINLRTGDVDALGNVAALSIAGLDGAAPSAAAVTLLGQIQAAPSFSVVGSYALVARFSEENLRKSSIEIDALYSELSYELPTGVNYFYSEPLMGKSKNDRAVELLTAVIGVGQDKKISNDILQVIDDISSAITITPDTYASNGAGKDYAAGSVVRPFIWTGNIDCTDFKTLQMSNLPHDVKQYVLTHIGNVIDRIHATSFYTQQLAGKAATYKVITSGDIISKLFSQPRMAIANMPDKSMVLEGGAAYRLELPTGTVIELHASTQAAHATTIVGMPFVSDPNSELNFGADWSFGIAVAHYVKTGASVAKRLVANSRESFVPTNPIAFRLSVSNLDAILTAYAGV